MRTSTIKNTTVTNTIKVTIEAAARRARNAPRPPAVADLESLRRGIGVGAAGSVIPTSVMYFPVRALS
jgi:hypothetical protein